MYQQAVDAFKAALEVNTRDRAPAAWARDENNLASLYESVGAHTHDSGKLSDAAAIYGDILDVTSKQDEPVAYWQMQGNRARTLNELGNLQTGTDALEQSIAAAKEALSLVPKTQLRDWAKLESLLGNSTAELGLRRHDKRLARMGRDELAAAWKAFKAVGDNYDGFYTKRLGEIDKALKAMK
jgi:tetratricopeptide (TPR) repeat protein